MQQFSRSGGFTLVELVVGIVLMASALAFLSTLFFANPARSVEPLLQIRAAEYGQALMDEILSKPFDENTPLGGVPACVGAACTARAAFGSDAGEGGRADFDDVDDYHDYCDDGDSTVTFPVIDSLGTAPEGFGNYRMRVCIEYDGDYNGAADTNSNAKLISVELYPPSGAGLANPIVITAYRGNF